MKQWLPRQWYSNKRWLRLLHPLSMMYGALAARRREAFRQGRRPVYRAMVPVVVVGNLTAGGTGKTPLTLALCRHLQHQGWQPAIVSRGYGGRSARYPLLVTRDMAPATSGDEALLMARNTDAPVVVDPDRGRGVRYLESMHRPDVILCDDGLQHYALARDIEIVVVDGMRGFGNARLLPAGPLREPLTRLGEVDFVVVNQLDEYRPLPDGVGQHSAMRLTADRLINIRSGENLPISDWLHKYGGGGVSVHAVAGIGNPARFFDTLQGAGFAIIAHSFADHHQYRRSDISFADALPVVMTEKDAVKCRDLADEKHWYLTVQAQLSPAFLQDFTRQLSALGAVRPHATGA